MLKKIFSLFFIIGLLLSLVSPNVLAADNQTELIKIVINDQTSTKLDLSYYIVQNFKNESRGIFLALPKNQNGVWTDYNLKLVQRTNRPIATTFGSKLEIDDNLNTISTTDFLNIKTTNKLNFQLEPYDEIKEWDQFRLRVGKADRILDLGIYVYKIDLEMSLSPDSNYDLELLQDWRESVGKIEIIQKNQNLCDAQISCSKSLTALKISQDKPKNALNGFGYTVLPYLLILLIISGLSYLIWLKYAKDPMDGLMVDKPEFEPPDLKPWEADYLLQEGNVNVKETLLAYILWLNNQKFIKLEVDPKTLELKPEKRQIQIIMIKDLPNELPAVFNKTVEKIAELGMKEGVLDSKINEDSDAVTLNAEILKKLAKHYDQKPIYQGWVWIMAGVFLLFFVGSFVFGFLQEAFLVGNSYGNLAVFALISTVIPAAWILHLWGRLSKEGAKLRAYCQRYKYYIEKVETLKLDFSNNPQEGVQYYLKAVAFAAAFGLLPKFCKYFSTLIPNSSEISSSNNLLTSYAAASFYVPPSSSGGGSGGGGGGFSGGGGSW